MHHSMLWGHMLVIRDLLSGLPKDAHGNYMHVLFRERWRDLFPSETTTTCPPIIYMDAWPFLAPFAICLDAGVAAQFTQDESLPKPPVQKYYLRPMTAGHDLSSQEGAEWKVWRRRFNPALSAANINARIPDIVDEIEIFVGILKKSCANDGGWGKVMQFEKLTTNLTVDIITRFMLWVFSRRTLDASGEYVMLSGAIPNAEMSS